MGAHCCETPAVKLQLLSANLSSSSKHGNRAAYEQNCVSVPLQTGNLGKYWSGCEIARLNEPVLHLLGSPESSREPATAALPELAVTGFDAICGCGCAAADEGVSVYCSSTDRASCGLKHRPFSY